MPEEHKVKATRGRESFEKITYYSLHLRSTLDQLLQGLFETSAYQLEREISNFEICDLDVGVDLDVFLFSLRKRRKS